MTILINLTLSFSPSPGHATQQDVDGLSKCNCRAKGLGVTFLNHTDQQGRVLDGKDCAYKCQCQISVLEKSTVSAPSQTGGLVVKEFDIDHALGKATSFEAWDYGNYTCHGQYVYMSSDLLENGRPNPRYFQVKYLTFEINKQGEVTMPNSRQISRAVVEIDFRYTRTFPELIEAIRQAP